MYHDVNVLTFTNIADAFGGFDDTEAGNQDFVIIANRSLYKFFTYEPPPTGVPTDPMGPVHIVDFQWPFSWWAKDMKSDEAAALL